MISDKMHARLFKVLRLIFGFFIGFYSYMGVGQFFHGNGILSVIAPYILTLAFFLFVIFIHEMGHALAAMHFKYRVHFIAVGIFGYNFDRGKFEWVSNHAANEIAGYVNFTSPYSARRKDDNIVSLAGPLATLILGIFLILLDIITNPSHMGLALLSIACFLDAIFNLIPLKAGRFKSDGRQIFENLFR